MGSHTNPPHHRRYLPAHAIRFLHLGCIWNEFPKLHNKASWRLLLHFAIICTILGLMANNSSAFTEFAIFCQHASLALLWATVLPLAVNCFLNSSYEFIITTCSSWVTYIAPVRSVGSIASRWITLGYALYMWTRIETKAENLAWQIYFKWASWNCLTLIYQFR